MLASIPGTANLFFSKMCPIPTVPSNPTFVEDKMMSEKPKREVPPGSSTLTFLTSCPGCLSKPPTKGPIKRNTMIPSLKLM